MTERTIERAGGALALVAVPVRFDEAFNRADVEAVMGLFDEVATMRMTNGAVIETDRSGLRAALTGCCRCGRGSATRCAGWCAATMSRWW